MRTTFCIRDILWLTLVAALGIAWELDHSRQSALTDNLRHTNIRLQQELDTFDAYRKRVDAHYEAIDGFRRAGVVARPTD